MLIVHGFDIGSLIGPCINALLVIFVWLTKRDVKNIANSVNGKMDALLEVTGQSEKAKGFLQGTEAEAAKHRDENAR